MRDNIVQKLWIQQRNLDRKYDVYVGETKKWNYTMEVIQKGFATWDLAQQYIESIESDILVRDFDRDKFIKGMGSDPDEVAALKKYKSLCGACVNWQNDCLYDFEDAYTKDYDNAVTKNEVMECKNFSTKKK